jgi:hypothetical protein
MVRRTRGVKQVVPIMLDAQNVDVPYCGKCGRNYPRESPTPREKVTSIHRERGPFAPATGDPDGSAR